MYAHAETHGKTGKPCDGFRYDVFHAGSSLDIKDMLMGGAMRHNPLAAPHYKNSEEKAEDNEERRKGGKRCGGALYFVFHPAASAKALEHKPADEHYSHEKSIDKYVEATPGQRAAQRDNESQTYAASADMSSVEKILAYTAINEGYRNFETSLTSIKTFYSRIESELSNKAVMDIAYAVAEEVERKYGKKYSDKKNRQYEGRVLKNASKKNLQKREQNNEGIKKALKNVDKEKAIKELKEGKKQAKKNEIHRRSLPSGPKAVRKGHKGNSGKSAKGRLRHNLAEQLKSREHKKKYRDSGKI